MYRSPASHPQSHPHTVRRASMIVACALCLIIGIGSGAAAAGGKPAPLPNVAAVRAATHPIDTGNRTESDQPRYTRHLAHAGWDYSPNCDGRNDWYPVGHVCHRGRVVYPPMPAVADLAGYGPQIAYAERVWGASIETECSSLDVYNLPRSSRTAGEATLTRMGGGTEPCELGVRLGMPGRMLCTVIIHEVGHLLGMEHDNDPSSIMYGGPLDYVNQPLCQNGGRS